MVSRASVRGRGPEELEDGAYFVVDGTDNVVVAAKAKGLRLIVAL